MIRIPSLRAGSLLLALLSCTVHAQNEATESDHELVDRVAKDYKTDPILRNDPELNFTVLALAKTIEAVRIQLLDQNVTDDAYWEQVNKVINEMIGGFNSPIQVQQRMREFFDEQVAVLKARGKASKDNNHALTLLAAAVHNVMSLNYEWKRRTTEHASDYFPVLPDPMRQGVSELVAVEFDPSEIPLDKFSELDIQAIEAKLVASLVDCDIRAITPERQALHDDSKMLWRWEIRPSGAGQLHLYLNLVLKVTQKGKEEEITLRSIDRKIFVQGGGTPDWAYPAGVIGFLVVASLTTRLLWRKPSQKTKANHTAEPLLVSPLDVFLTNKETTVTERGMSFGDAEDRSGPPQYSETVNINPVEGKLKILFLAANPEGQTQLKLGEEYRDVLALIRASEFRDRIDVTMRPAVRHADLAQALMEVKPHIVHFSGHGSDRDELILQDDRGSSHRVSRKALTALFKTLKDDIRLVVFNACFSKPQAEGIVANIAFAIGMNQAIGDKAATKFAEGLYQGIGFGRTVQEAFDLGTIALQLAGIGEELTPQLLNHPKAEPANVKLINVGGVANEKQKTEEASMTSGAVQLWKERLSALLEVEALEDDPTRKLRFKKQIEECRQKIGELTGNP